MKVVSVLSILLALGACKPSEAEVLQAAYDKRSEKFPDADLCEDAKNVAAAWAREGEQEKYENAHAIAQMRCL